MAGKYKDKYIDDATSLSENENEKIERVSEAIAAYSLFKIIDLKTPEFYWD